MENEASLVYFSPGDNFMIRDEDAHHFRGNLSTIRMTFFSNKNTDFRRVQIDN